MRKHISYLKFIGYFELICFCIGIVFLVISAIGTFQTGDTYLIIATVLLIISYAVFGPAIGLLFLIVADVIDKVEPPIVTSCEHIQKSNDIYVGAKVNCSNADILEKYHITAITPLVVDSIINDDVTVKLKYGNSTITIDVKKSDIKLM